MCWIESLLRTCPKILVLLLGLHVAVNRLLGKFYSSVHHHLCALFSSTMSSTLALYHFPLLSILFALFILLLSFFLDWSRPPSLPSIGFLYSSRTSAYVTDTRTNISYLGITVKNVEHFQNIFYAKDTSGSSRFAPPIPHLPVPGTVVDATTPGAFCPQGLGPKALPFTSPTTNVSENCLSLRIMRSVGMIVTEKLPVMGNIHGGLPEEANVR